MPRLTVLYDAQCGLCTTIKRWLGRQKAIIPLEFVPAGSPRALRAFPELSAEETRAKLTVILDGNQVYRGDRALVMCLWALKRHRAWAIELAALGRYSGARRFFTVLSERRQHLSKLLRMQPEVESTSNEG